MLPSGLPFIVSKSQQWRRDQTFLAAGTVTFLYCHLLAVSGRKGPVLKNGYDDRADLKESMNDL